MTFSAQFSKSGQPKTSVPWMKMKVCDFGGVESFQFTKSRRPSFSSPQISFLVLRFCQIDPKKSQHFLCSAKFAGIILNRRQESVLGEFSIELGSGWQP
jgi:hypothetical protein